MKPAGLSRDPLEVVSVLLFVIVFTPLFFQLDGRIYTDPATLSQPRGMLSNLPIPISVPVTAIVLSVLVRRWVRDRIATLLMTTIPLMLVTSLVAGGGTLSWVKAKLLLFQFGVPMMGFVVGRQVGAHGNTDRSIGRWLLGMTAVVAIAQLLSTWVRHRSTLLTADALVAAVYGHLQYVPAIVIVASLVGLFFLWGATKPGSGGLRMLGVMPVMALYAAASMSMTAIAGLWGGLLVLGLWSRDKQRRLIAAVLLVSCVALSVGYVTVAVFAVPAFQSKFLGMSERASRAADSVQHPAQREQVVARDPTVPPKQNEDRPLKNLRNRLIYWKYFLSESGSSARAFLFGHPGQPPLSQYPSAHNYYLDLLYNFGFLSMVPLIAIGILTVKQVWQARSAVAQCAALAGLVFATGLLLLVDNGLKVGMRQPYPGLATFFLWGVLASRTERMSPARPR